MIKVKQLISYLRTVFGSQICLQNYYKCDDLPMYLTENYSLFTLQIDSDEYILVKPKDGVKPKVDMLKKQMAHIQRFTKLQPVLLLETMRLPQRNALIQARIPFIVPEKQIYIPHCAMNLTETESADESYGDTFAIAAQVVFIFLLLNKIKKTNAHQLCEQLSYSVATVNRALKELCYRKLLKTIGSNTRKQYTISSGTQFWEDGKRYLFDPVKVRRYVVPNFGHGSYLMSGELALCRLSYLSGTSGAYYACTTKDFKKIDKAKILNEYDVFDQPYSVMEVFRYDPKILANGNYIDVISLYAQFKDNKDERVQIEIESLVNEILW